MFEEMRTLLEDDSIPFTTEAEFNQIVYVKELERVYKLVVVEEPFASEVKRTVHIKNKIS